MDDSPLPAHAKSITEPWVALDHFTDRHDAVRRFAEYLNVDPAPETVLFFHGVGGNGKTVLTRFLHERCAKRLEPKKWPEAYAKTGDGFVRYLSQAEPSTSVPKARIDFRDGVEDVVNILLRVSRQLASSGMRFPIFTYSCVQYWKLTHQYSPEFVKQNFPEEELEFVSALVNDVAKLVPGVSVGVALVKCIKKHLGPTFNDFFTRRQIDTDVVDAMARWEPSDLLQKLPAIFAADLNAAMTGQDAPKRVVLSFDTYERFWGEPRNVIPNEHPERDQWLRELLTSVDRAKGVVTVVAGRERPWWADRTARDIPLVEAVLVGEFADNDAADYLARLPNHETRVRSRLIELARVGPDRVHPLLLGLAADIAIAGHRRGEDVTAGLNPESHDVEVLGRRLLDHLLMYVDDASRYALRALAACRRFDYAIYCYLGETSGYEAKARFAALTQFSFIEPSSRGQAASFEMHELLRRLFREEGHRDFTEAHEKMEIFYRARKAESDPDADPAKAEAIYHANQLDAERGLDEWVSTLDDAVRLSTYGRCRLLVDLLPDLAIESDWWRGRVFQASGDFFSVISAHAEALAAYDQAVDSFDAALTLAPNAVSTLNNRGTVLRRRGTLLASLSRTTEALAAYDQAVDSFDAALTLAPEDVNALNNKGTVLQSRGALLASLSRTPEALAAYDQAVISYDAALTLAPKYVNALNNRGNVLQSRGTLLASLSRTPEALAAYDHAVDSFDAALTLAPEYVNALNNRGNVLQSRGALLASLSRTTEALAAYDQAVDSYDAALTLAPNRVFALWGKGETLLRRGRLSSDSGDVASTSPCDDFRSALALLERAITIAPGNSAVASLIDQTKAAIAEAGCD